MMRAVEVSKDILHGRVVGAATDSASSPNPYFSSGASAITPPNSNSAEQALWYDYAAFILHATSVRDPPVDLSAIREGLPRTDADQLSANLAIAYADKDKLQRLTEQFMQQNKQRIITTMRATADQTGIGLESVD